MCARESRAVHYAHEAQTVLQIMDVPTPTMNLEKIYAAGEKVI